MDLNYLVEQEERVAVLEHASPVGGGDVGADGGTRHALGVGRVVRAHALRGIELVVTEMWS